MTRHLLGRRDMMLLGAGLPLLGANAARAQSPTSLTVMIPNIAVNGKLREIAEAQAKVKIVDEPFVSTPDTVSKVLAPGGTSRYDLIMAQSGYSRVPMLGPKAGAEKAAPLDLAKIPNAANIADLFKPDIVARDGVTYGLPYFIGYDSVVYNADVISDKDPYTQSWGMIFDDKYAGKIAWFDTAVQMLTAAALYLGKAAPETMSADEVAEVGKFLISKKKNVRTIWTTFSQAASLLSSGEVLCAYGSIPVRMELQQQGKNFTNAWPKEGVLSFVSDLFIPKDCAHIDAAHALFNTLIGPPYVDQLATVSGYLPTNKLAGAGLSEEQKLRAGFGIYSGQTKATPLKLPTALNVWIETWSKVKSA